MGNAKEALSTIINKLEDIQEVPTQPASFSCDILCCVNKVVSAGLDYSNIKFELYAGC
jgi:hypothetical protein